ncbi:sulfate ABC transporter permease subunit CysT [Lacticaseibacillus sp. GG6-2]
MKQRNQLIPGFTLALCCTIGLTVMLVAIPLASLVVQSIQAGWHGFSSQALEPRVLASYWVSLKGALLAAIINTVIGFLLAWVLAMYRFPGRGIIELLLDLPFALPTSVAGIALAYLYSTKGWIGQLLAPMKIAYTFTGIVIAMVFVTLPFVVRSVQPVLAQLDHNVQEAAITLGASPWRTFRQIILPEVLPALWTGFSLVFARALGEYGSVIFIAGNQPYHTEIAPLMIMFKLEAHSYTGATVIAVSMLAFALLFNLFSHSLSNHLERGRRSCSTPNTSATL